MTRYEWIKTLSLEELGLSRIDQVGPITDPKWVGDFCGEMSTKEEALKEEIEWLGGECDGTEKLLIKE